MPRSLRVFVTGASGFVGRRLCQQLVVDGHSVKAAIRKHPAETVAGELIVVDLLDSESLARAMQDVDAVVHLAGRAHVLDDRAADPLTEFRQANVDTTLAVARAAITAGVKRFVFISSIGVNGAETSGQPFNETMVPRPNAAYALSKLEAEQKLGELFACVTCELVIIRPPLVYDACAPGKFARLLRLVEKGLPLPFAGVGNRRCMVSLFNLVDFITLALIHERAAGEVFVIADGESVSTQQIVELLASGMGHRARFFFVPSPLMGALLRLLGRSSMHTQLYGSLEVDTSKAKRLLGWVPRQSASQGLINAGQRFKTRSSQNE